MNHLDRICPKIRNVESESIERCDNKAGILKTYGMRRRTLFAVALSTLVTAGCGGAGSENVSAGPVGGGELRYTLVKIPPLPGDNTSRVAGINNHGIVVANSSILPDSSPNSFEVHNSRAYIWNGGVSIPLPTMPGFETGSSAIAINDVGTILGIIGRTPVLWEGSKHIIRLLPELSLYRYDLFGLNNNGTILAPNFLWENGVITQLPKTSPYFYPTAFNDNGMVAGFRETFPGNFPQYPVILKGNAFTELPFFSVLDGQHRGGQPNAINNNGLAIGQSFAEISPTEAISRAVTWENGQMTDLSKLLPATAKYSSATSVNNNGDIIGKFNTVASGSLISFIYKNGAITELQTIANEMIPGVAKRITDRGDITLETRYEAGPDSFLRLSSLL